MPLVPEATSDIGYFRFHGRNLAWFTASRDERYNYLYNEKELGSFVDKIKEIREKVKKIYVFFNNCHHGQAARNAKEMLNMLQEVMEL